MHISKNSQLSAMVFSFLALCLCASVVSAKEGEPLAIRLWPSGVASIETQWNLNVAFGPAESEIKGEPDLIIVNRGRKFGVTQPGGSKEELTKIDHILDRAANQEQVKFGPSDTSMSENAIQIKSAGRNIILMVDGVRLAICVDKNSAEVLAKSIKKLKLSYVVCPTLKEADVASLVSKSEPANWIVVGDSGHNTLAASSHAVNRETERDLIKLSTEPWKMPAELKKLFEEKEASCNRSRKVFAGLSVKQPNFKPANGTHTPRWNCEHMMGRELLFFSQIYAAQSSTIKPMNLNPKQMPADYSAKHPDWTGKEEALQMKRVEDFSRRFAYLMADLDLDEKAAGSFWTPRKLLMQMERHYDEHTANVKKKFELENWPEE